MGYMKTIALSYNAMNNENLQISVSYLPAENFNPRRPLLQKPTKK